uniref:Protein kinase domain-containing protein n=1 Tax=Rhabditophanes sp. KR3021 TaxID=114890 RepID=A0AC35TIY9_9BILA
MAPNIAGVDSRESRAFTNNADASTPPQPTETRKHINPSSYLGGPQQSTYFMGNYQNSAPHLNKKIIPGVGVGTSVYLGMPHNLANQSVYIGDNP